jgi:hypothetical protein
MDKNKIIKRIAYLENKDEQLKKERYSTDDKELIELYRQERKKISQELTSLYNALKTDI